LAHLLNIINFALDDSLFPLSPPLLYKLPAT
jgi:hypothetical protein